MSSRPPHHPSPRRTLGALFAGLLALTLLLGSSPAPTSAATSTDLGTRVINLMNRDRVARGLVPLRPWPALASLATYRAQRMAATTTLSHTVAGSLGASFTARGIPRYAYGEIIGMSNATWGSPAASHIYSMWKASPSHAPLMFSARYNYVGAGFAYRSSNGTTWASVVFSESPDHTRPIAVNVAIRVSGTSVSFRWRGYDPRLQTRTAGLRSFDVQYRRDNGAWTTIRNDTTTTSLLLTGRARGHWYSFRVQAADRRGNLSAWTSARRVWVP